MSIYNSRIKSSGANNRIVISLDAISVLNTSFCESLHALRNERRVRLRQAFEPALTHDQSSASGRVIRLQHIIQLWLRLCCFFHIRVQQGREPCQFWGAGEGKSLYFVAVHLHLFAVFKVGLWIFGEMFAFFQGVVNFCNVSLL
jgi:hypothetical protein